MKEGGGDSTNEPNTKCCVQTSCNKRRLENGNTCRKEEHDVPGKVVDCKETPVHGSSVMAPETEGKKARICRIKVRA